MESNNRLVSNLGEILRSEHQKIDDLFARIVDSSTALTQKRTDFQELKQLLKAHADREEAEFYPLLVRDLDSETQTGYQLRQQVNHFLREHQEFRDLIGEIDEIGDSEQITELVSELRERVTRHVLREESELIPRLRSSSDQAA